MAVILSLILDWRTSNNDRKSSWLSMSQLGTQGPPLHTLDHAHFVVKQRVGQAVHLGLVRRAVRLIEPHDHLREVDSVSGQGVRDSEGEREGERDGKREREK
jgi:hypothetical protein